MGLHSSSFLLHWERGERSLERSHGKPPIPSKTGEGAGARDVHDWGEGRRAGYLPTRDSRLTDSLYWQTQLLLFPSDHIHAAALALAQGS